MIKAGVYQWCSVFKAGRSSFETKRQSMTWNHPSSPTLKNFKVAHSAKKLMATEVWGLWGILLVDFLPPAETVNTPRKKRLINNF